MVVAMAVVRMMQPSVYEVIDVIAVRHGFVSAARTVLMSAPCFGRTAQGVGVGDVDDVLVDVISMHVMQMTIVQVIDMAVMAYGRVPAVRTVSMRVIMMMRFGTGSHGFAPPSGVFPGGYPAPSPSGRSAQHATLCWSGRPSSGPRP
jgi:hypothetical protein